MRHKVKFIYCLKFLSRYVSRAVYPHAFYPDYLNGPIYMFTVESIRAVLALTDQVNVLPMEDVLFTGILADEAGVKRINDNEYVRTAGWVR
jgi:hypothetical protein